VDRHVLLQTERTLLCEVIFMTPQPMTWR
jgi:hypothetical protein